MARSTVRQPVPAAFADHLATGYVYAQGSFQPQLFEVMQIVPACAASATASDMAQIMLAHLGDGRYDDDHILTASTTERMHQRHFGNDPRVAGMAYGFYELHVNGRRLLTHAGETSFFRSQIFLLPEETPGIIWSITRQAVVLRARS